MSPEPEDGTATSASTDAAPAQLRRASSVPLYFQLAEILKERIEAGHWAAGERFPSERELAEEFHISRTVIRPALELLASDGQLVRIKGRGTFVTPPKTPWPIAGLARLLTRPPEHDFQVRVLSTSDREAEPDVRQTLELGADAPVLQATAVILSAGEPVYMTNSVLVVSELPDVVARLKASRTPGLLTPGGTESAPEFAPAHAAIATAFVSQWEATQLELSAGDLCFLIRYLERVTADGRTRPVEFARVVFRSDTVELETLLA